MGVLVTWPFLYFLQLLPGVGHLVIAFQRSLLTYCSFSALFLLMFFSFAVGFYILMQLSCTYDTGTYMEALYFTFQIFLNQIDIAKDYADTPFLAEWMFIHFVFLNITTILLLNFCIAILSQSFSDITQYGDVIQRLQSLNIAITISDRIGFATKPLRRLMKCDEIDGIISYAETVR